MKQKLLLFLTAFPILALAQPMTVSTTLYTVPQLVNNVLINAPCQSATNVSWRTGTNYGGVNGIGYFQNTNPIFPMGGGVILATTAATSAPGPNNSNLNPPAGWPGDPGLAAALGQSPLLDATVVEFDFAPTSAYFSLDFIYASEEYTGTDTQCTYSDRFALLLTNTTTGVTENLAVVPNTNIPISGLTVRDAVSGCQAVNPQYFGESHVAPFGDPAASATNFNGETVVLKAQATVTTGAPYHFKMVVADKGDSMLSSAIFLGQNSLNVGQEVLGRDWLVATDNAACNGNTYTLTSGLSASDHIFLWNYNGAPIASETGPTLTITQPGTYSLTYASVGCAAYTDNIVVEFQDCLGIAQSEWAQATLYPNPTESDFTIAYPLTEKAEVTATVRNILGQTVYTETTVQFPGKHEKVLSLQNQPSGMYLVQLTDGKNTFNGKVIKK